MVAPIEQSHFQLHDEKSQPFEALPLTKQVSTITRLSLIFLLMRTIIIVIALIAGASQHPGLL
jgi:hypothetical protein